MKNFCITLLLILISACASKPKAQKKIFPFGVYHHQVVLRQKAKQIQFSGIHRWTQDGIAIFAMGPMNMTLLKYEEEFKTNKKKIYLNQYFVPVSEARALMFLGLVKDLYALDHSICKKNTCRSSIYGQEFTIKLNDFEEVSEIVFERGANKANIQVVSYEKIP